MALGDLLDFTLPATDPNNPNAALTTPEQIARRQAMADALTKQGMDYSPVQSPWQGAARMANALVGAMQNHRLNQQAGDANKTTSDALTNALLGLKGGAAPSMAPGMAPSTGAGVSASKFDPSALPTFAKAAGDQFGVSPDYMARTAYIESKFNPNADNGIAKGLYQFTPSTGKAYGLADPFNPQASAVAAAKLASDNRSALTRSLGRAPSDAELYLAHQQGAGGAAKLLANPNAPAASIVGQSAVVQNGGRAGMTAGEFANMWLNKYNGLQPSGGRQAQADLPAPGAVNAGGAPLPPGAEAFAAPQADPGLASAMFNQQPQTNGGADYTLGSRGMNDNNNGAGMTEIAPGSVGPMSARTAGKLGGGAPEATNPAQLQMVARLLRGDAAPPPQAQASAPPAAPPPTAAAQAPSPAVGAMAAGTPPSPDAPAPGAVPTGPAPMPPSAPAAPLRDTGDGSYNNPFLEGSPQAAQAQQAGQAKAQQAQQGLQVQQLMGVIQNPYTSQAQRQVATTLLQKYIGQDQVQTITDKDGSIWQKDASGKLTLVQDKGKIETIGKDAFGNDIKGTRGQMEQRSASPGGATTQPGQAAVDPSVHGAEFMATLPPALQPQVQAVIEGRAPYPTGMFLKTPMGQQIAQAVTQADPSFETGNATSRVKVRNEFNSGGPNSPAGAITAGNTAIQHLGHLSDAAEKLGNYDSSIPGNNLVNAGKNMLKTGPNAVPLAEFNNIVGKYVEEATKFYRGTGGTESDIQRDISHLSPNMSPSELHAAIKTQAELLQSKINALQDRWKQGMGPLVPEFPIVHPESAKQMDTIRQRAGGAPAAAPTPAAASGQVAKPQSEAEYNALPPGAQYIRPGETTPRIKGGK